MVGERYATRDGRRVMHVHEQRPRHGDAPFGKIIKRTPPELVVLYRDELALPLYDGGDHQRACLRVMLAKLGAEEVGSGG